ncbi:hypothetical protein ADL12_12405 [Streptomyces regalis]|uniref:Polymerase/histidinol phosphatase N-terminal domain-containing protein n=1 Tax=Streptomyces regalis TaxID=68262 RepID=A0A0X3V8C6_9ACTN|nr:hypothetical protein ADL12_12405 [Streptomyces regalis]
MFEKRSGNGLWWGWEGWEQMFEGWCSAGLGLMSREVRVPGFTHLHTVSGFSLRYGASHPERLAERASERGMDALALTDRDSLGGAVRFAKACAATGVRPLFGVEPAVEEFGLSEVGESVGRGRRVPVRGGTFVDESMPRVTFLARDGARGGPICAESFRLRMVGSCAWWGGAADAVPGDNRGTG